MSTLQTDTRQSDALSASARSRSRARPKVDAGSSPAHPRTLGWRGTTALAMGGSNQSLFLIGALVLSQRSFAIPLLGVGLLLSLAAAPGWTELVLMWPNRVGGKAATCAEAFRRYNPVLANIAGGCYWWGWVPTCGLTAILSVTAIQEWYLPGVPIPPLASGLVLLFADVNLYGVRCGSPGWLFHSLAYLLRSRCYPGSYPSSRDT